jgi:hypothetical protein
MNLSITNKVIAANPEAAKEGLNEWIYRSGSVTMELIDHPNSDYTKSLEVKDLVT